MASEISSTLYATRRKEVLALVNQLRAVGAQNELDLPRITVIGNQSAGKSSVVEAISGINVPRDAGTCTRCPMECRLSSSPGPWSCRISIRREYDENGERLDEVSETPFGAIIKDKSEVEIALRRAQFAVLNSHIPHSKIISLSADELRSHSAAVPFSQNVVCVDLEGPELTDLSFIDLPGLIQNAEPDVVQLVEDMAVSHIRGNCIILVAVPMTDDIENQKALRLARMEDPDGRRTIGVLTKPDMLGTSLKARKNWLEVIEGQKHPLMHGYYCTRQPDDEARTEGMTPAKAREIEAAFFRDTEPWSRSTHKHRFGTNNLVSTLSNLLLQIINETLPRIRQDATTRLEICRRELSSMPKAIEEDAATFLLKNLTSFCNTIQKYVLGSQRTTKLIHEHRARYKALKIAIRRTAPNFVPSVAKDPRQEEILARLAEDEEDEDGEAPELSTEQPFNLTQMRKHIERSVTRELAGNVPFDAKVSLILDFQKSWKDEVRVCFQGVERSTEDLLVERINNDFARFNLLRGHMVSFIRELISQHRSTCEQFLEAMLEWERTPYTQNNHYFQCCAEKWLAKYKAIRNGEDVDADIREPSAKRQKLSAPSGNTGRDGLSTPTNASSTSAAAATNSSPAASQASNTSPARTSNGSSAATRGATFGAPDFGGAFTFGARKPDSPANLATPASSNPLTSSTPQNSSSPENSGEDIQLVMSILKRYDINIDSQEELWGKLLPVDEYEQELKVMAEVRGYFQVAYKRVMDNIPSCIDAMFLRALNRDLQPFLISKFGMGTASASERCASYLGEDPLLVTKRTELLARSKMLESVKKELDDFGFWSENGTQMES